MSARIPIRLVGLAAAFAAATSAQNTSLDDYIDAQRPVYLQSVLDNIGPDGVNVPGTNAGFVVASPSTDDPDYFYTWTRDSALTFKMMIEEFVADPQAAAHLQPYIRDYIRSQAILQTVTNPSGGLLPSGRGLGEPKYQVDGTRFNGAWGRPQHDGPPLRAVALISYAKWLAGQGEEGEEEARDIIWPVIRNDLSYVGQYWNSTGFDLWEEVSGSSFFTTQSQYRALVEGAQLADLLGLSNSEDGCGDSCDEAPQIGCFLNSDAFWNGEHFAANINNVDNTERTARDANTALGSNVVFDIEASCDSPTVQPCHSRALASFKQWVDEWRDEEAYPINEGIPPGQGIAIGRYTEDVYYGGNPWYLITFGAAEFLYNAAAQWTHQQSVTVDATSRAFFEELYPTIEEGTHEAGTPSFEAIVATVEAYGDSFVEVARNFTPADGSLAEQYDRYSPFEPVGATDLTWSYAAFMTMSSRRNGIFPSTWVPTSEELAVPSECTSSSVRGRYEPAVAAGAPNTTEGLCAVPVRFNVLAETVVGQEIFVVGSVAALGEWDIENAQPLTASGYTQERPLWSAEVEVEGEGGPVDYVFVRLECDGTYAWETTNRTVEVPSGCSEEEPEPIVVEDTWDGPASDSSNC